MGTEIERKFRVRSDAWRGTAEGTRYRQGYLCTAPERTVRVRVAGPQGFITVKGLTRGASRAEFEYPIPLPDAEVMLDTLCEGPCIDKVRYRIPHAGHTWEVDVFEGGNLGLVIAEVELTSEAERVELPSWVGEEVTQDTRFQNSNLVRKPFRTW